MKREKIITLLTVFALVAIFTMQLATKSGIADASAGSEELFNDPYIGSMHPHVANEGPGKCDVCGMNMIKLEGHKSRTPLPSISNIYFSPDNLMYAHEGPGKDPKTGTALLPITESPIYEPPPSADHTKRSAESHSEHQTGQSNKAEPSTKDKPAKQQIISQNTLYTCGMHPDVMLESPGSCPICGMVLTPMKGTGPSVSDGERKVAYWQAPMDPNYISDQPGKSPMGMDLVPVYEDEVPNVIVRIDPVTLQNIGVTTTEATVQDLHLEIRSNGSVVIAEDLEYRVNPKISGWIEKLYVARTGDLVEIGEPLLEIYSPQLVSAQEEYLLALNSSQLLAASGIRRVNAGANELIAAARRRLELWDISPDLIDRLDRTKQVHRTLTLYSPANGTVMHKSAIEGAVVKAGTDLFRIADLSTVWVDAQLFEYELLWVEEGASVEINSPYNQTLSLHGIVDYVYPYLESKTRTVKVRIEVPNPKLDLRPDMYVDVTIKTQSKKGAVVVPKNAVLRSGKRDIVFIELGKGRFMPHEVQLGLETNDYYEVAAGLASGTSVVTSAQFLLDSEAKLQEAIQRRLRERMGNKASMTES